MADHVEVARRIIADSIYCTLAIASVDGDPWISPVFFAYDQTYAIFWVSSRDARHSRLIRANPRVAIAIFNSQLPEGAGDGVYCTADVVELSGSDDLEDIAHAIEVLNARITQDEFRIAGLHHVTGAAILRVYRATPTAFSKLTEGEIVDGQYIDRRVDVDLRGGPAHRVAAPPDYETAAMRRS